MRRSVSATEARIHFGDLLERVARNGDTVIVEHSGTPQAVVLSVAEYERMVARTDATSWRDQARAAREQVRAELGSAPLPLAEDVIRAMREERDAQLGGPK